MKILITGGSGFVGGSLVRRLLKQFPDSKLTVVSTGSENKLPEEIYECSVEFEQQKHKVLYQGLEGIDWTMVGGQDLVIHLAANNDTQCKDCNEVLRANLYGPIKLFVTAAQGGCKKFIYASSTAVYGNNPVPYTEDQVLPNALTHYADSKKRFEEFAQRFSEEHKVSAIGLRFCNVYGPGEDHKGKRMSMIGQMLRKIMANQKVRLFKDGEQKRDWIHVDDVSELIISTYRWMEKSTEPVHEILNVASGEATSFNQLFCLMKKILHKPNATIEYVDCPFESSYQSHTECSIEKARSLFNFEPCGIASGIADYARSLNAFDSSACDSSTSIPCIHES